MSLSLNFLAVGNADCIILLEVDHTVVVDAPQLGRLRDWLKSRRRSHIDCLFFTHDHADHFSGLAAFAEFARAWLDSTGTIGRVCLPARVLERAKKKLIESPDAKKSSSAYLRLKAALSFFSERSWYRKLTPLSSGTVPLSIGDTTYTVLWPPTSAIETWSKAQQNALSLVLKVEHGPFAALLMGDLDGDGLSNLVASASDPDPSIQPNLRANLIKVPHHGAWPRKVDDFRSLLKRVDPEYAILSVGSTNTYRHVRPELFTALLDLKRCGRLGGFACTEVTRTCVHSTTEREAMGRRGLPERQPCAGDIEIEVGSEGDWRLTRAEIHAATVAKLPRAACRGTADL